VENSGGFSTGFPQGQCASKLYRIRVLKLFPQFPQALLLYLNLKKKIEVIRLIQA
jgi:hypothetical protein